jgi:hypothetical protein
MQGVAGFTYGSAGLGGYAVAVEPWRLDVTRYALSPAGWPKGLRLRIAALADIHACEPWMDVDRIADIVQRTNALAPDLVVLLGDYAASHRFRSGHVPEMAWARELQALKAPLGVHAVLGNHDWWDDLEAQRTGRGPVLGRRALEACGIPVYENAAVKIRHQGHAFWLAGLGDQLAFRAGPFRRAWVGVDDLDGTLAQITDRDPVILLAHEPDAFPRVPGRIALTLSGHTHGGQVRVFGYAPIVPSRYQERYAYGHIVEEDRHLIVSGGLGCSVMPVRLGVPPEIVVVEVGA